MKRYKIIILLIFYVLTSEKKNRKKIRKIEDIRKLENIKESHISIDQKKELDLKIYLKEENEIKKENDEKSLVEQNLEELLILEEIYKEKQIYKEKNIKKFFKIEKNKEKRKLETTIQTIITEPIYNPFNPSPRPKIILLGFGHYKSPPPLMTQPRAFFITYSLRLLTKTNLSKYITFTVRINYLKFRILEEKVETCNCTRITYDIDDNIRYNCSFPVEQGGNYDKVSSEGDFKFIGIDDNIVPDIIVSSIANETLNNLVNATNGKFDRKILILNQTEVIAVEGLIFELSGIMVNCPTTSPIIMAFDEGGNGKIKNATCNYSLIDSSSNRYKFECTSETSINAPLLGVIGVSQNGNEKILVYPKDEASKLIFELNNLTYRYSSSSGLSGGIIAIIIIACVIFASLIIILIIVLLKKKPTSNNEESNNHHLSFPKGKTTSNYPTSTQ